jgi:hypothetical protein
MDRQRQRIEPRSCTSDNKEGKVAALQECRLFDVVVRPSHSPAVAHVSDEFPCPFAVRSQ